MQKMLNEEIQKQLRQVFTEMKDDVTIVLFTQEGECYSCDETLGLLEEVEQLSDKIHLKKFDINKDVEEAKKYNIEMVPSFVLLNSQGEYQGVKFNGIPAGHEINSFIPALIEMSGVKQDVPADFAQRVAKIDKPVNIKVFVTLSCPHCPGAVQKAHVLAMLNKNIEGEMIEAQTFNELSNKFNVSGVPKIVINDKYEMVGNQPIEEFLAQIEAM